MPRKQSESTQIAVIAANVENIKNDVSDIKRRMEKDYVTNDKHMLVSDKVDRLEKIIYGVIMLILATLIAGYTVIKK